MNIEIFKNMKSYSNYSSSKENKSALSVVEFKTRS
jgi:hypothetical protein